MQNEDSQFLTLNELDTLFAHGRVGVGLSMSPVGVTKIKGEVL
jgi:hypothetical protein